MMRCRICNCWIAPEWLIRAVEFVVIVAAFIMPLFIFIGCSQIMYTAPDGTSASYTRIGKQDINGLRVEKDATGMYRLVLDKQSSDSDVLALIKSLVAK